MWLAGLRWISDTLGLDDTICWAVKGKGHPSSWRGLHSVGVAAAGWLESESEYRRVQRAEIEAPDDGKRGPLALPMFRQ